MNTENDKPNHLPESRPLAHVRQLPNGEWIEHFLDEHLLAVAELAAKFASAFNSQDWAHLSGLWHDLGKFREKFQKYIKSVSGYDAEAHIEGAPGRVDHSTAGAIHAIEKLGPQGRIIAYLIAGHHAGLPDWNGEAASLFQRLENGKAQGYLHEALLAAPVATLLNQPHPTSLPPQGSLALWVRMLFSCLVDADFLDTEAFMDGDKSSRRGGAPEFPKLLAHFDQYMAHKAANAKDSTVNRIRADVLRQCREKSASPSGMFSLTVPTGGGKTLSSMAFALNHAMHHGKQRVIYVIPYTSIIEQTAQIFKDVFGKDNVIEHHSNLDPAPEYEKSRSRLATENWDAPIIVTTNVQFFESLFAAKTSRCRKLHNIVNSVVVLDEAQLLPPDFLAPILHVMQDLASPSYKVSFVLSTATQPAFSPRPKFSGLKEVRELMDDPAQLYEDLKRVEAKLPDDFAIPSTWESIADELQQYDSVLCIVNSRKDCRELHALMPQNTIHLSALMCGQHRSKVIADIKQRLKDGIPTRVISTQLVEAGVDMDFPVVYRALAGLDAVAQAAGRCNREGVLPGMGKVVVFVPPKPAAPGLLRKAQQSGQEIMRLTEGDPLTRERFEAYFQHYYASFNSLDKADIVGLLDMHNRAEARIGEFNFRTAAEKFRLIDEEGQTAVIVRYGESANLIAALEASQNMEPHQRRGILRKLQRYTVNIRDHESKKLLESRDIREIYPGVHMQSSDTLYHPQLGLLMSKDVVFDPAQGVV